MSVGKVSVVFLVISAFAFLSACGGGGSGSVNPVAPPTGGFSNSNLDGTYVFSISGTDENGAAYAMAGTFTANGSGGISGGTLDINDTNTSEFTAGPAADVSIGSGSSYGTSVDGRGTIKLQTNIGAGFPTLGFSFVLQNNSHGLISELDSFGSGSGTVDLQSSSTTPTGSYAFLLSGGSYGGSVWAAAGNFAYAGGSISGTEDLNEGAAVFYTQTLSGTLSTDASTPSTRLITANSGANGLLFDAFSIDSTHIKLIEMDETAALSGDAFSQTSTTLPTGNLAFTLSGLLGTTTTAAPFAAGGVMANTSGGSVTGTEDYNEDGTSSSAATPPTFTGTFAAGGTGRYTFSNFTTFVGGSTYAAYPSSGGLLLLEMDAAGVTLGSASAQSSTNFAAAQGYALNLSGTNLGEATGSPEEVDDIAEFTANSTGTTVTGAIDENYAPGGTSVFAQPLSGTYGAPANGRGAISAAAGSNSNSTLNGGFNLIFYTVDGTTFPFIEVDSGQVSSGVFVQQSATGTTGSIATAQSGAMYVPHAIFNPHAARAKKQ